MSVPILVQTQEHVEKNLLLEALPASALKCGGAVDRRKACGHLLTVENTSELLVFLALGRGHSEKSGQVAAETPGSRVSRKYCSSWPSLCDPSLSHGFSTVSDGHSMLSFLPALAHVECSLKGADCGRRS